MRKRKRGDASASLTSVDRRPSLEMKTLKCTLGSALNKHDGIDTKDEIVLSIRDHVLKIHRITSETYELIRLYLQKAFEEDRPFPDLSAPNNPFILWCVRSLTGSHRPKPSKAVKDPSSETPSSNFAIESTDL